MKLQDRKASTLGFGFMGGCHVVWDKARQKNSDYLGVAHIYKDGTVKILARVSDEQKNAIEEYAKQLNHN